MSQTNYQGNYRHVILATSTVGQVGASLFHMGVPYLIPALTATGLALPTAALVTSLPAIGIVLTLVLWGWVVDRTGERFVLGLGLSLTAVSGALAAAGAFLDQLLMLAFGLLLSGMAAASVNSASGRVVSGWYPPHQRGLAMGIRQMAQPLAAGLGALVLPFVAANYSIGWALVTATSYTAVVALACILIIRDPDRPERGSEAEALAAASPYQGSNYLMRIHMTSALLSAPQSTVGSFMLVWLMSLGWTPGTAGALVTISQFLGAGGRALGGFISDRVHSRMRPIRWVAGGTFLSAVVVAGASWLGWTELAVVAMVCLSVGAVADNGLAFTAVAEYAGPLWSGRSMGLQNTFQNIVYSAAPPVAGLLVGAVGFPAMWALLAVSPAAAFVLVPERDLHRAGEE
ncbi:MFS transporter [Corynebacterium ulceribovis]|uniref:MFS transporter n=1 Tax=Corynebacterium ulceribovis TaxID=487732 RepID=UPI00036749B6|nr:MFS transporter [Corynebacterium ulceribovis]